LGWDAFLSSLLFVTVKGARKRTKTLDNFLVTVEHVHPKHPPN
jgi:hypothetical protein